MFKPKAVLLSVMLVVPALTAAQAAEPLAEPIRVAQSRGLDFQRSVTVTFEWKLGAPHASEEAVRQALQSQGFTWSRTEARESLQSSPKITISASRSGKQQAEALSTTIKSVSGRVSGFGNSSWSISQQN